MPIAIVPFAPQYAEAFARLNLEWIERFFAVEDSDRRMLGNPQQTIIDVGGQIFVALDGETPVGVVAAIPEGEPGWDLAKMAVSPAYQGRGIGEMLGRAAVEYAWAKGARRMFLETNSRLANAVRLYERLGFRQTDPPQPSPYARSDVYMEIVFP